MNAHQAWQLSQIILEALRPMCERIEVAGSIRRGRPTVGDIDLVLLPKPGAREAIRARCLQRARLVSEGEQTLVCEMVLPARWQHPGGVLQLDLWFARPAEADLLGARPGNWGTLLLCRTGSKEHNIRLAQRAATRGLHWQPHQGLFRGRELVAAETEESIFDALGLQWIPPGFREGTLDWRDYELVGDGGLGGVRAAARDVTPQPPAPADPERARAIFAAARARLDSQGSRLAAPSQPSTLDPRPSTFDPRPSTFDPRLSTSP
jgi:hypothetical protein